MSICRLCLTSSANHYEDISTIDLKNFQLVLPEININLVKYAVLCSNCVELLRSMYSFKNKCLETERLVKGYAEMAGELKVCLADVLRTHSLVQDINNVETVDRKIKLENESMTCGHGSTESFSCDNCKTRIDKLELNKYEHYGSLKWTTSIKPDCNIHSKQDDVNENLEVEHVNNMDKAINNNFQSLQVVCRNSSVTRSLIKEQEPVRANKEHFTCTICHKILLSKRSLIEHMKVSHSGMMMLKKRSKRSYVCDTCGLLLCNKHALITHIRTHTGEKPYKCEECGKAFSHSSTLRNHKRNIHSSETLFTCEHCSISCKDKGSLANHILDVHMVDNI